MRLNKNTHYTLLVLLAGHSKSLDIARKLPNITVRTIQRCLDTLQSSSTVIKTGPSNNPTYSVNYGQLLAQTITQKYLEDYSRPETTLNFGLFYWLASPEHTLSTVLEKIIPRNNTALSNHVMSKKDLEYLTVELSWKSSALEGNTYTLLDTKLLLEEGIKSEGKTAFETQMIINHKEAIDFSYSHPELFSENISFSTVEELHRIHTRNLGINNGIRKRTVKITATNYVPLNNPYLLRELMDKSLQVINEAQNPIHKALLALTLVPYIQAFEDGNKRLGRLLANAILINTIGTGFSLKKVSARQLALAYIEFYEFNSIKSIATIMSNELENNKSI